MRVVVSFLLPLASETKKKRRAVRENGTIARGKEAEVVEGRLRKYKALKVCRLSTVPFLARLSTFRVCILMIARGPTETGLVAA